MKRYPTNPENEQWVMVGDRIYSGYEVANAPELLARYTAENNAYYTGYNDGFNDESKNTDQFNGDTGLIDYYDVGYGEGVYDKYNP